mgnify:CR=1 FL=1
MISARPTLIAYFVAIVAILAAAMLSLSMPTPVRAQEEEPIAYVGHGGFFDRSGRQIVPTAEFVERAQEYYRERLLAALPARQRAEYAAFVRQLGEGLRLEGQSRLVLQQRALDRLVASAPRTVELGRMRAKLSALRYRLQWRLPRRNPLVAGYSRDDYEKRLEFELGRPQAAARPGSSTSIPASAQASRSACA